MRTKAKAAEPGAKEPVPAPGPSRLDRAENRRLTWHYQLKPGQDYKTATEPSFWYACAGQLTPMSRIEVCTHDHRILFEAIVLEANPHAFPHPRVDLFFRPIMPADLALPSGQIEAPSRYVAKQLNINGNWQVDDVQTGEPIQTDMTRHAAMTLVGVLEAQIASAVEEQSKAKAKAA